MTDIQLSDERYVCALKRLRDLIASGSRLVYYDDETPGNKNTECTWGLCSERIEAWPDKQDYLWPDQPNRIAPKYRRKNHKCPMDMGKEGTDFSGGCFYRCRIFKGRKPTREQALALYDAEIAKHV